MQSLLGITEEPKEYQLVLSRLVLEEIEIILGLVKGNSSLRRILMEPIQAQLRSRESPFLRRSFLALLTCKLLGGTVEYAIPAGAAIELFVAALDVFDDVEDMDAEEALWRNYGHNQALNAATALLMLAQLAVGRLRPRGVGEPIITRVMETMASAGITACAGQHYDLDWESRPSISEGQYFNMIKMKSASLVECACRSGAILAGADERIVNAFGEFGLNFGMAAQITNDVSDVQPAEVQKPRKSDIIRRKKTLPIIFAINHATSQDKRWLASVYQSGDALDLDIERKVRAILQHSGALCYSVVQAELYRQKALKSLKRANISEPITQALKQTLGI